MTKPKNETQYGKGVEVVQNRVMDAYRQHRTKGANYLVELRQEACRGRQELASAAARRAKSSRSR